jgi:anti-anti-sigma factor
MDNAEVRTLVVDLTGVDYLDSSALGMLLMVRDKASSANKAILLANAQSGVKQVLDIANFSKLFKMV